MKSLSSAGRFRFLIVHPSVYILLRSILDIVGHLQQDFDTGTRLYGIRLYVTIFLMRL